MERHHMNCLTCGKALEGRSDKKYCNNHCKSALQYANRKREEHLFFKIDRQLKLNRKLLKQHNKSGKSMVRKEELVNQGFDPNYFTNYWKNSKGKVYLFCYEYGFMEIEDNGKDKYLLVQWQNYME
jgi:predicted nucleic acid-binding Zn ribbon protein